MIRCNCKLLTVVESLHNADDNASDLIQLKKIEKNSCIIFQNKKINRVYIIKKGILKCYLTHGGTNKNFILEFLGNGEIAGGIAVLQGSKAICNVEAITDVYAYEIAPSFYLNLLKTNKQFNSLLMETLSARLHHGGKRTAFQQLYMLKYSVQKIQGLFKEQEIKIDKADLAAYLGISKRSLNRVLKGLVEEDGKEIALRKNVA